MKQLTGQLTYPYKFYEVNSDTTYNGVCSTLLNNCEEGTLTEIGHQEDAEHSTPGGLTHTINQK
ncbi:hypothetical protein OUZ56_027071 [Daphnia magna]|uniref:Uncharacterized protein n=1 Tax=Daphnia magna TaxID=35525 RepID=A0ABQ9ZNN3_9CRUS|nr:hypothetical protein OUZ56_027071 [Daphnia magna]